MLKRLALRSPHHMLLLSLSVRTKARLLTSYLKNSLWGLLLDAAVHPTTWSVTIDSQ